MAKFFQIVVIDAGDHCTLRVDVSEDMDSETLSNMVAVTNVDKIQSLLSQAILNIVELEKEKEGSNG